MTLAPKPLALTLVLLTLPALGQQVFQPATIDHVTKTARDGQHVFVRGKVTGFPDSDVLTLKDDGGSITVDLDRDPKQRDGVKLCRDLPVLCKTDQEGLFEPVKELDALVIDRDPGASPVAPPATGNSLDERLATLKRLYDKGLITKEDYETRKKAILDEI